MKHTHLAMGSAYKDIRGSRYGFLTVVRRMPNKPGVKCSVLLCSCDCGAELTVKKVELSRKDGKAKKHCGSKSCALKFDSKG